MDVTIIIPYIKKSGIILIIFISLVVIISAIFIIKIYDDSSEDSGYHGEIWGDVDTVGQVIAYGKLDTVFYSVRIHESNEGHSNLTIQLSNISEIDIYIKINGTLEKTTHVLENNSITLSGNRSLFISWIHDYEYTILYDQFYSRMDNMYYQLFNYYGSISIDGTVEHDEDMEHDIKFYWMTAYLPEGPLYISNGRIGLPQNEDINITITGYGNGWMSPYPVLHVNGTVTIRDFREGSGAGRFTRVYDNLTITSRDITIRTEKVPVCWSEGSTDYVKPWTVWVSFEDDAKVETTTRYSPLFLVGLALGLILLLVVLYLAIGKWRKKVQVHTAGRFRRQR